MALTNCLVCNRAKYLLEELSPQHPNGPTEWRVSCYGCQRSTFRCRTKEEAMHIHTRYLQNLEVLRKRAAIVQNSPLAQDEASMTVTDEVNKVIEACAQIVEKFVDIHPEVGCCYRHKTEMAKQIRVLKQPSKKAA